MVLTLARTLSLSSRALRQGADQLPDVRHADPGHHVVAGAGMEGSVAAGLDVAEAGGPQQRVEERVEERQPGLVRLDARLVDQGAEPRPDRRAPARAADLQYLAVQDEE